jgi:hypothetical protein
MLAQANQQDIVDYDPARYKEALVGLHIPVLIIACVIS